MKKITDYLILFLFVLVVILFHYFGYTGHYGYDDLHYAELAVDFINGILDYSDHYSYRTPVIVITALFYVVLGVGDLASALPAMLITIFILYLVFMVTRKWGVITMILSLGLTLLSKWFLFYSDKLMPDIYLACFVFAAIVIIYLYWFSDRKGSTGVYATLFSLFLFFGFMAKGTIILTLPLLLFYVLVDFYHKRHLKFWLYAFMSGGFFLLVYFAIIWVLTGDILSRFSAITSNSYLNFCSYNQQPALITLKRVGYEFFELLIKHGMAVLFIFLPVIFSRKNFFKYFRLNEPVSFWIISAFILLLSSNFMTISFTSYSPMCLDPRHYLFLIPVSAIPTAIVIYDFLRSKRYNIRIISFTILLAFISFFIDDQLFYLYLPLAVIFICYQLLKLSSVTQSVFVIIFLFILSIMPLNNIKYAQLVDYKKQRSIFKRKVLDSCNNCIVVTNDVQKRLGYYYLGFKDNEKLKILNFNEFEPENQSKDKTNLLVLNSHTRNLSGKNVHDLPLYARNASTKFLNIYKNEKLDIFIYEINMSVDQRIPGQIIIHSKNGFEETQKYWKQDSSRVVTSIVKSGSYAFKAGECSPTFEYPIDSLLKHEFQSLTIEIELNCLFMDKSNSKLVFSVENNIESYVWKEIDVHKYIKAYGNWWPVTYQVRVNTNEIRPNSRLKIYLWNKDNVESYIDDFEILIRLKKNM